MAADASIRVQPEVSSGEKSASKQMLYHQLKGIRLLQAS